MGRKIPGVNELARDIVNNCNLISSCYTLRLLCYLLPWMVLSLEWWWPGARPFVVVDDCESLQVPDSCSSVVRAKVVASKFHSE